MSEYVWDAHRCKQLAELSKVLQIVSQANQANDFINKIAVASLIAESLTSGEYPTFELFLYGLARSSEELQKRHWDATATEQLSKQGDRN